jgi:ABC-type multidrug transport system fused ATPase/permease subunit
MSEHINEPSQSQSYLDAAIHLTEAAKVRPGVIKSRLMKVFLILAVSILVAIVAAFTIARGSLTTESTRIFASFVLIGALMTTLASIASAMITLWTAYVVQYIRRVATQDEVMESTNRMRELLSALDELSSNRAFVARLTSEMLKSLKHMEAKPFDVVVADLSQQPEFRLEIREAMYLGLRSRTEVASLLDEWEGGPENQVRQDIATAR